MAQDTTIPVGQDWTLLTNSDVTNATWQNKSGIIVQFQGTVGATPPTDPEAGVEYQSKQGETNRALSDIFLGVSGVNRLYARCESGTARVFISHA